MLAFKWSVKSDCTGYLNLQGFVHVVLSSFGRLEVICWKLLSSGENLKMFEKWSQMCVTVDQNECHQI